MQHLFLDCSHGMSGDMTLASLAHLGVDLSPLPGLLAQAGVACRLEVWQEERGGGPGCRVEVSWEAEGQPLRHPADIAAIFAAVPVADRVRHKALAVLEALTLAEAEAHGIAPEEVHFHEVGAVDTLVDILGACWALDQLGVERVTACALPWFGGSITCAHGEIPLPAPATANLMRGLPVYPTEAKTELVTPTGAALARVLVDEFVEGPEGRLLAMGTGYGARPAPTGLRAWLVEAREPRQAAGVPSRPSDRRGAGHGPGAAGRCRRRAGRAVAAGHGQEEPSRGPAAGALPSCRYGKCRPGRPAAYAYPGPAAPAAATSGAAPQGHDLCLRRGQPAGQGI